MKPAQYVSLYYNTIIKLDTSASTKCDLSHLRSLPPNCAHKLSLKILDFMGHLFQRRKTLCNLMLEISAWTNIENECSSEWWGSVQMEPPPNILSCNSSLKIKTRMPANVSSEKWDKWWNYYLTIFILEELVWLRTPPPCRGFEIKLRQGSQIPT